MKSIRESQSNQKTRLVSYKKYKKIKTLLKRQAGVKSELQENPQEMYNIRQNAQFNIKVTMIIKSRSETASISRKYKDNCLSQ